MTNGVDRIKEQTEIVDSLSAKAEFREKNVDRIFKALSYYNGIGLTGTAVLLNISKKTIGFFSFGFGLFVIGLILSFLVIVIEFFYADWLYHKLDSAIEKYKKIPDVDNTSKNEAWDTLLNNARQFSFPKVYWSEMSLGVLSALAFVIGIINLVKSL